MVAKVEWRPDQLYPTVGFIVTNVSRPAERVGAFYNQRGTAEQWIKECKNAVKWTRTTSRRALSRLAEPTARRTLKLMQSQVLEKALPDPDQHSRKLCLHTPIWEYRRRSR